jgi:hypothetical protein
MIFAICFGLAMTIIELITPAFGGCAVSGMNLGRTEDSAGCEHLEKCPGGNLGLCGRDGEPCAYSAVNRPLFIYCEKRAVEIAGNMRYAVVPE